MSFQLRQFYQPLKHTEKHGKMNRTTNKILNEAVRYWQSTNLVLCRMLQNQEKDMMNMSRRNISAFPVCSRASVSHKLKPAAAPY